MTWERIERQCQHQRFGATLRCFLRYVDLKLAIIRSVIPRFEPRADLLPKITEKAKHPVPAGTAAREPQNASDADPPKKPLSLFTALPSTVSWAVLSTLSAGQAWHEPLCELTANRTAVLSISSGAPMLLSFPTYSSVSG